MDIFFVKEKTYNRMILYDLQNLLDILELDYFPTKEELKKHFKYKLIKYHPDTNKQPYAHEKTIELMKAYQCFMLYYSYYEEEYLKSLKKEKKQDKTNEDEINTIQVYECKNYYLGLPLHGLIGFLDKRDVKLVTRNNQTYIFYNRNYYKVIEENKKENHYCFVLYNKPFLFSYTIFDKIKFVYTIRTEIKNIVWNESYGILNFNSNTIYIPLCLKNVILNQDEISMSPY